MIKRFFLLPLVTIFSIGAQEHVKKINVLFSKHYQDFVYQDRVRNVSIAEINQNTQVVQTFCFDKNKKLLVSFYDAEPFFAQWCNKSKKDRVDAEHQLPISSYALYKRNGTHLKKHYEIQIESSDPENNHSPLIDNKPYHFFATQIAVAGILCCLDSCVFNGLK
ncbi:MAG TPA: hypothetical protein VHO47_04085 [Candidatus Babeliales bacterium]|nr:hypothetical protein [Candidatus Babeliales bacterium]